MATDVFYSVSPFGTGTLLTDGGVNPTIVVDGSGNATVTLNDATWTHGDNIGVGVTVEYNSIISYIDTITSATSFHLVTTLGANASSQSSTDLTSVHYEYASLSVFEAGFTDASHVNNASLVTADIRAFAPCYYDHDDDTPDTAALVVAGHTDDSTRYLEMFTPQGLGNSESINDQRHNGISSSESGGKQNYRLERNGGNAVQFISATPAYNTRLIGLEIYQVSTADSIRRCIQYNSGGTTVNNYRIGECIIRSAPSAGGASSRDGIEVGGSGGFGSTFVIYNTIIYGGGSSASSIGVTMADGSYTLTILNCTIYNWGLGVDEASGIVQITNSVVAENTTDFNAFGDPTTIDNCASDDGTGSNPQTLSGTRANDFTDVANGDFSLVSGSVCIGNGLDDPGSGLYSTDIVNFLRTSIWDISAFEFVVVGGGRIMSSLVNAGGLAGHGGIAGQGGGLAGQ